MQTKFERIKKYLQEWWGFTLTRNTPDATGRYPGDWKSGYTIQGRLRGSFFEHYRSLAEIERSAWMRDFGQRPGNL